MASPEEPFFYCWNGRTKVATTWTIDTAEAGLLPTDANCSIYLSYEQSQQHTPSFRVRFDNLVTRQCQPLIRALLRDGLDSDIANNIPQVSRNEPITPSARAPAPSTSCSLILHPPHDATKEEAFRYNVTTRNFFAWIAGAPTVGTDPAYALIALKVRMDMWRNSKSDNIAAIREYAERQGYTDLAVVPLSTEVHFRSFVSPAANYKLTSARSSSSTKTSVNTATRLKQTLGLRAGAMLKRKSDWMDSRESLQLDNTPCQLDSNETRFLTGVPVFPPVISPDEVSRASFFEAGQSGQSGSSSDVVASSSSRNHLHFLGGEGPSKSSLSLSNTSPDTLPEIPELDDVLMPCWPGDDDGHKGKGKEKELSQNFYTSSLPQAPSSTESLKSYNTSHNLHSSNRDRRRPQSRAGSGPPSPIMEEAVIPRRPYITAGKSSARTSKRTRRYSFDTGADHLFRKSESAGHSLTVDPTRHTAHSTENLPAPTSYYEAVSHPRSVCAACKRRKKPDSPDGAIVLQSVISESDHHMLGHESSNDGLNTLTQFETGPTQLSTAALSTEQAKEGEELPDLHRFPSLHGFKLATVPIPASTNAKSDAQLKSVSRSSTLRQTKSASQPAKAKARSSSISGILSIEPDSPGRSLKGTPVSEQCYTPSSRSRKSISCKKSHETVVATRTNPTEPVPQLEPDEYTLGVDLDKVQSPPEPKVMPKRISIPERATSIKRAASPVRVTCPEPVEFPIMMKSNGSRHPLALMLQDEQSCMIMGTSMPADKSEPQISTIRDDTIMLDRLLDGFHFINPLAETSPPRNRAMTPSKTIPLINTSLSPSPSSQLSPRSPTSSHASARRSWTGSLRKWRTKDSSMEDIHDSLPDGRPVSKSGQIQIRVMTMDRTGKFSTEFVDSPVDTGGFVDFR